MDRYILLVVREWLKEAHLKEDVMYDVDYNSKSVMIYTTRPGWLIGRAGYLVLKYTDKMHEYWPEFSTFQFKEAWGYVKNEAVD